MKNKGLFIFLSFVFGNIQMQAQTASASDNLVAQPIPDRTILYNVSDTGVSKPLIFGLDLAWLSEENVRRGIAFMGKDRVGVVRSSFTPTAPLVDGELQASQLNTLNSRINIINKWLGQNTQVVLNDDNPSVDPWFAGNAQHWAQLIDVTARHHQEKGLNVITVSPFNEPDYTATGQGTVTDFYNIAGELKNNPRFDSIRISGGNTLNTDQALSWYNTLKSRLDEGNTHQLAGSFDNFANFFTAVRADGNHATDDEMHNVMEAMAGVEYGMQTGIWWGTAEYARGEFVKASDGKRLSYAEHRPNWTAASVYRSPEGKIQAFGGTSERQAVTTTYRFVSKDRDVYYDGYGPQREYTMTLPGGAGYQKGQTNAERVVGITWGDDIQPVVDGAYVLVNRNSGKVIEVAGGLTVSGANVRQATYTGAKYQQWNVNPVDSRIGGDFSYVSIIAGYSGKSFDIVNYSLEDGGRVQMYDDNKTTNQQWYLEYAGDGWFYIRSRHSAKCIEVANASTAQSANIQQGEKAGGTHQQWRFLPVGAPLEFEAPAAPTGLVATANEVSIRLDWTANPETDVAGYTIFRSDSADGAYNTIARNVKSTAFVDNSVCANKSYFYAIRAIDNSLNRSPYSNQVSATATGNNCIVADLPFDENTLDCTANLNHGAPYGNITYVDGNTGSKAASLDGTSFIQLPVTIANHREITIAAWVYWKGGAIWQRIFDFGNGENENMYLTPRADDFTHARFAIKNGGAEQQLNVPTLPLNKWTPIAVTLGANDTRLYINGELAAQSNDITISPIDFKPVLNYIGRSQYLTHPLFKGYIDNFMVFNYALPADEIKIIADNLPDNIANVKNERGLLVKPVPANDVLYVSYTANNNYSFPVIYIYNMTGQLVLNAVMKKTLDTQLDVSTLPNGIYLLKLIDGINSLTKEIHVIHK